MTTEEKTFHFGFPTKESFCLQSALGKWYSRERCAKFGFDDELNGTISDMNPHENRNNRAGFKNFTPREYLDTEIYKCENFSYTHGIMCHKFAVRKWFYLIAYNSTIMISTDIKIMMQCEGIFRRQSSDSNFLNGF